MHPKHCYVGIFVLLLSTSLAAQQPANQTPTGPTTAAEAPSRDTSYIDEKGTAHVTRVVPVPQTISIQSQHFLSHTIPDQGPPESLADRRKGTDAFTAHA